MEFRSKREALDFYEKEYPYISRFFIEMAIDLDIQEQREDMDKAKELLLNLSLTNNENYLKAKQRRDNKKLLSN